MAHSRITAGLCALVISAIGAPAALAQMSSGAGLAAGRAEAARALDARAREGLPAAQILAYERRLQTCDADAGACALLRDELQSLIVSADGPAPTRLIRSPATLEPGSDGEMAGATAHLQAGPDRPEAVDTDRPVVQSLTITPETLDIDAGETTLWVDYEITDTGGSYLDMMLLELQLVGDFTAPDIDGGQHALSGNRSTGRVRIDVNPYTRPGEYKVFLWAFDHAENSNDLSQPTPSVTIVNTASDTLDPVLNALEVTPDPLTLEGQDGRIEIAFDVSEPGGAGLDYVSFGLYHVDSPTYDGAISNSLISLSGETELQGRTFLNVPAGTPSGQYYISVQARDTARNILFLNQDDLTEDRTLTIRNGESDTLAPVIHRLTLTPDAVEASELGATVRVDYDVEDLGGSGLRSLSLWLAHDEAAKRQSILTTPLIQFNGQTRGSGSFNVRIPPNYPPGAYRVGLSLQDEIRNETGNGRTSGLATTQMIRLNEPGKRAFGPFPDVLEPEGEGRDIFRVTGLDRAPPERIEVAFRDPRIAGFEGAFSDCDLEVRPGRRSGGEYLILAQDLAACGAFGSADLVFRITPHPADLGERILLRRFRVSESGMLTDMVADRSPLSRWGEGPGALTFGPFEWTETPASGRLHRFRLSGLEDRIPQSMDIAIANAAADGFDDAFSDCAVDIPPSRVANGIYDFTSADLAACGDFGRADLSFRFTDIADYSESVTLTRLVTTADGSVTDFSFDQLMDTPLQPEAISGGRVEVEAGLFEWTGDANAPTRNLFRISGLDGVPGEIEVAINNAAASGYDGAYSDCTLQIRPERAGAHDYLISTSDLVDCGAFGRADLSFRITAAAETMPDGVRMRRIAIGAHGDLTDFNFDHAFQTAPTIREGDDGQSNVVFGPFEWTGDSTVGTQNVFRITGITGAPTRIQAALAHAASGEYRGSYLDCELTVRPGRVSDGDFVITSNDLADCGDFARANVTFRVFANTGQFSDTVRMRRFAVTRTGGLTDFGFDNQ